MKDGRYGPPPRQRPPWWPENEPWPPRRWGPGRHGPGSFAGFGCLVLVLFFVLSYLVVLMIEAANFAAGTIGVLLFLAIFFGAAAIAIPRMMRRTGGVLDELRRATGRVEDGDYSVRVDVPTRAPRPVRDLVRGFDTMVERLEADERQRRSLLADVSHELRTPLAILRGNVEAILDGVHPADEEHLGALLEETKVIERLIEDLRTVALSEAGTLALHREPVDVGIIAADVATTFRGTASAASVEIALDVPDDVPLLDADPVRLREILGNLVDNAIRHTPPGGTVTIGVVADPRSQVIVLSVADTGSGIAPELLPRVFDRFAKGTSSRGSGLGLAIAKALTEAHGGTIAVASEPGHGTTMTVRLPLRPGG